MEDIWKKKPDWDDALSSDLEKMFQDWCEELFHLKLIYVSKYLFSMKGMKDRTDRHFYVVVDANR